MKDFILLLALAVLLLGCTGNDDDDTDIPKGDEFPRVCAYVGGSLHDMNDQWTPEWLDGDKCDDGVDRNGEPLPQDCGYGPLTTPIDRGFPQCVNVTNYADLGQEFQYGMWTICSGYQTGYQVLEWDTELVLPEHPKSFCNFNVPDCAYTPQSHWGLLGGFSDGKIIVEPMTVADCCQVPGAQVQPVCNCAGMVQCDDELCWCAP